MNREVFIHQVLMYAGPDFIDWDNHTANLDSDEFISLLNAAMLLPRPPTPEEMLLRPSPADPELLILQGNQLLEYVSHFYPSSYNLYANILGDVVVLGIPTSAGGANLLERSWQMGINAASPHSDGAWEFLRRFLLPTFEIDIDMMWGFPLRIDLYNSIIDTLKTPRPGTDGDGSYELELFDEGGRTPVVFKIYAMTDAIADKVRHIAETAVLGNQNVHQQALFNLIDGDIASFFAGLRSAEDTARIIQNRVQTFLHEQQPRQ